MAHLWDVKRMDNAALSGNFCLVAQRLRRVTGPKPAKTGSASRQLLVQGAHMYLSTRLLCIRGHGVHQ
jgi:hypothetical protein